MLKNSTDRFGLRAGEMKQASYARKTLIPEILYMEIVNIMYGRNNYLSNIIIFDCTKYELCNFL